MADTPAGDEPTPLVVHKAILLDTYTLLWLVSSPGEVSAHAREVISDPARSFRTGGLELTQRTAHIGQRVPVLTRRTVLRRLRRLAGVGNRIPELSTGAIQRFCRTDPGVEGRQGSNRSGHENGDGRTT